MVEDSVEAQVLGARCSNFSIGSIDGFERQAPRETPEVVVADTVTQEQVIPEAGRQNLDWANNSEYVDKPRRLGVWVSAAVVILFVQWLPLAIPAHYCAADWEEDGASMSISVRQSAVDHPKYGYLPLWQHIVYILNPAVLVTLHIDHRGRWQSDNTVMRWTWRYAWLMAFRGALTWILPLVLIACPSNVLPMYEVVKQCSAQVHLGCIIVLNYLGVLRLRRLQQRAASKVCFILLTITAAIWSLPAMWNILYSFGVFEARNRPVRLLAFLGGIFLLACVARAAVGMWAAARAADAQAMAEATTDADKRLARAAASWTRKTAATTAIPGLTTTLLGIHYGRVAAMGFQVRNNHAIQIEACIVVWLDHTFMCIHAAVISGLLGPLDQRNQGQSLVLVGAHVVAQREQEVKKKLWEACNQRGSAAAAIQSLVDGRDANDIFQHAKTRFRRIRWEVLRDIKELMKGGPLDGHAGRAELYSYSEPCSLSECDVFVSHSWHDNFELKWEFLARWCEEFKLKHSRYPRLWVDKFCIDQCDIAEDVQCLPVFLAGCNGVLILAGNTYTSRLWCVMEVYVYLMMHGKNDTRRAMIEAIILGKCKEEVDPVRKSFLNFAAERCNCFKLEDKENIMAVIEQSSGGIQGFNQNVNRLAKRIMRGQQPSIWQRLVQCARSKA